MSPRTAVTLLAVILALAGGVALERHSSARLDHEREVLRRLQELYRADTALDMSVLELRAGVLKHFDPLVHNVKVLRRAAVLQRRSADDGADWQEAEIGRLVADLNSKEQLVEAFKTDLSLLRISSLHFPTVAAVVARYNGENATGLEALRTSLARYSVAPSKEFTETIARDVERMQAAAAPVDPVAAEARRSMLGHARNILERRMRIDDLARDIRQSSAHFRILALEDLHSHRQSRALVVVTAARTALAALCILAAVALSELLKRERTSATPGTLPAIRR